jgi:hypothetical protein
MYNNKQLVLGLLAGLIVPVVFILLIYLAKFNQSSLQDFIATTIKQGVAAPIIALSLMGNLGLFFLFLRYNNLWAGRGVIISTFVFGIFMVYLKLFL